MVNDLWITAITHFLVSVQQSSKALDLLCEDPVPPVDVFVFIALKRVTLEVVFFYVCAVGPLNIGNQVLVHLLFLYVIIGQLLIACSCARDYLKKVDVVILAWMALFH